VDTDAIALKVKHEFVAKAKAKAVPKIEPKPVPKVLKKSAQEPKPSNEPVLRDRFNFFASPSFPP
jgi:hypothetical protein